MRYDGSLEDFRSACQEITQFYIVERYPFAGEPEVTEESVRGSLEAVKDLIEKLRADISGK